MSEPASVTVGISVVRDDAVIPQYATPGSAAFDFHAAETVVIQPSEIKLISTGLIVAVPAGYFLAVIARSSTAKRKGLIIPNAVGVIDPDYRGDGDEVRLQFLNTTGAPVVVSAGERLAQGLVLAAPRVQWRVTPEPVGATRGGFGSTGER